MLRINIPLIMALLAISTGCNPQATPGDERSADGAAAFDINKAAASPTATAKNLRKLYLDGNYADLAQLIIPDRRIDTLELLRAIDEVVKADADLRITAETKYLVPIPSEWGFSALADAAGLFSRRLTIINERQSGDEAIVVAQQGGSVPLVRARFELRGRNWLYVPEPAPPNIANRVFGLAAAIREVAEMVEQGADYEQYTRAVGLRILPQLRPIVVPQVPEDSVAAIDEVP